MNQRRMTCACLVLLVVAAVTLAAGCGSSPNGTLPTPPPGREPAGKPPADNDGPGPPPGGDQPPGPPAPAGESGGVSAEARVWLEGWASHLGVPCENPLPSVFLYPAVRAGGIDGSSSARYGVWPPDAKGLLLLDLQLLLVQDAKREAGIDAATATAMLTGARDWHSPLPHNWVYLEFDKPVTLPVGTRLSPSSRQEGMPGVREVLFVQEEGCDYCTIIFSTAASESPVVTAVRCPPGWLEQTQAIYFRNASEAVGGD